jgi:PAS domain S-box-containing protein
MDEARLLEATALEIGAVEDTQSALQTVLRRICETTDWGLGQVWLPNPDGTALELNAVWVNEPGDKIEEFVAKSRSITFAIGQGSIGRVWVSKQPVWIVDVTQSEEFCRRAEASSAEITTALAVPVLLAGDEVIAVLEFLRHERREEDETLKVLVSTLGMQLGWTIRHKRALDAFRASTDLLRCQNRVLELVARGSPLQETLDFLLREIEEKCAGMLCSILLLDADGVHVRHGSAPSLPESFVRGIDGQPIGPRAGSCGTAAFRREPVIVEDIATDPLWDDYRELALQYDLRACWSTPIFDGQQHVLGTFALYFRTPGVPAKRHNELIEMATQTAAIAIMKQRETAALRASEERLRLAVTGGRLGIWEWDIATNRLTWNDELKASFGWTRTDELTLAIFMESIHAEDRFRIEQALQRCLAEHADCDVQYRVRLSDGSLHWIEAKGRCVCDSNDRLERMVGVSIDITERKLAEEQIGKSRMELQEILDNSPALIYMKDRAGRYVFVNRSWTELFHTASEEVQGKKDYEIFPEETARQYVANDQRVLKSEQALELEEEAPLADGVHYFQSIKVALRNSEGRIYALCGISTDISERKRAEEALRQTNRALRVLSHCNSAVVHATEEQALLNEVCRVAVGPAGYKLAWVGYADHDEARTVHPVASAGPAEGFLDRVHVSWADNQYGRGAIGPAIREGRAVVVRNVLDHPAFSIWRELFETRKFGSLLALPLRSRDSVFGALAVYAEEPGAFDSTEVELLSELSDNLAHGILSLRAQVERTEALAALELSRLELEERVRERTAELVEAKEAAESADRLKSTFLATMSHELRTPLNSIIGFTGIVSQGMAGPLNPEQTKQLTIVKNSARHLLDLINDVLDISKIEAGQLEVQCEEFSLPRAIEKVAAIVSPLADKKGIALHTEVSPEVGSIIGDQRRTEQILLNLVGNAVKFTDEGSVIVRCWRENEWLVTAITDTGIGIDPQHQESIFEPFRQADTGLARKREGTGLGLSICKRLLEHMGGIISVESVSGQGSTFTIQLPMERDKTRE